MRELTKSMLRFTWSMSVFGLAQSAQLLAPRQAAAAFDDVTRRTEEQLGSFTRSVFNAGDRVQRGLVDLAFRTFGLDLFGGCSSCSRTRQTPRQESGWGPIQPPPGP